MFAQTATFGKKIKNKIISFTYSLVLAFLFTKSKSANHICLSNLLGQLTNSRFHLLLHISNDDIPSLGFLKIISDVGSHADLFSLLLELVISGGNLIEALLQTANFLNLKIELSLVITKEFGQLDDFSREFAVLVMGLLEHSFLFVQELVQSGNLIFGFSESLFKIVLVGSQGLDSDLVLVSDLEQLGDLDLKLVDGDVEFTASVLRILQLSQQFFDSDVEFLDPGILIIDILLHVSHDGVLLLDLLGEFGGISSDSGDLLLKGINGFVSFREFVGESGILVLQFLDVLGQDSDLDVELLVVLSDLNIFDVELVVLIVLGFKIALQLLDHLGLQSELKGQLLDISIDVGIIILGLLFELLDVVFSFLESLGEISVFVLLGIKFDLEVGDGDVDISKLLFEGGKLILGVSQLLILALELFNKILIVIEQGISGLDELGNLVLEIVIFTLKTLDSAVSLLENLDKLSILGNKILDSGFLLLKLSIIILILVIQRVLLLLNTFKILEQLSLEVHQLIDITIKLLDGLISFIDLLVEVINDLVLVFDFIVQFFSVLVDFFLLLMDLVSSESVVLDLLLGTLKLLSEDDDSAIKMLLFVIELLVFSSKSTMGLFAVLLQFVVFIGELISQLHQISNLLLEILNGLVSELKDLDQFNILGLDVFDALDEFSILLVKGVNQKARLLQLGTQSLVIGDEVVSFLGELISFVGQVFDGDLKGSDGLLGFLELVHLDVQLLDDLVFLGDLDSQFLDSDVELVDLSILVLDFIVSGGQDLDEFLIVGFDCGDGLLVLLSFLSEVLDFLFKLSDQGIQSLDLGTEISILLLAGLKISLQDNNLFLEGLDFDDQSLIVLAGLGFTSLGLLQEHLEFNDGLILLIDFLLKFGLHFLHFGKGLFVELVESLDLSSGSHKVLVHVLVVGHDLVVFTLEFDQSSALLIQILLGEFEFQVKLIQIVLKVLVFGSQSVDLIFEVLVVIGSLSFELRILISKIF